MRRHPLVVDKRVLQASSDLGIKIEASPEKWLVNSRLCDCLRILELLGSTSLSLPEYFKVREDAIELGDHEMLRSLESDQFIEILATVFLYDRSMIHHPVPDATGSFSGNKIAVTTPKGRYGWIHPNDIDPETGLPTRVLFVRNIDDETLKYWDTHTDIGREVVLMTVRGYVTSVGKISLDLGFPADAIFHKLSIREARSTRPEGTLDEKTLDRVKAILSKYYARLEDKTLCGRIPGWWKELVSFTGEKKQELGSASDVAAQVLKEDIADAFGIILLTALNTANMRIAREIQNAAQELFGVHPESVSDERMTAHLTSSQYLETLDGLVLGSDTLVEHPHIVKTDQGYSYEKGTKKRVTVPEGKPGLIDVGTIDQETGLPTEVKDPRQYGTNLWRYWSPDSECAWVLRSTIFAYDMPALDLKFDFSESLPRLAIRPCVKTVTYPRVDVYEKGDKITVDISD